MASVARLLTIVDVADEDSVSARHEAVLADGRRVVLLADRGWNGPDRTVQETQQTARVVVGPDEPFEGRTQAEMEASHWDTLARILQTDGLQVDAARLRRAPHDVELSDRVLARISARRRA